MQVVYKTWIWIWNKTNVIELVHYSMNIGMLVVSQPYTFSAMHWQLYAWMLFLCIKTRLTHSNLFLFYHTESSYMAMNFFVVTCAVTHEIWSEYSTFFLSQPKLYYVYQIRYVYTHVCAIMIWLIFSPQGPFEQHSLIFITILQYQCSNFSFDNNIILIDI